MSILDKLKTIGLDFSKLRNIKVLNFAFNIDKSIHIHADGATVTINPDLLNGKQQRELKNILRETGLYEAGAILNERELPAVESVRAALPEMKADITQFQSLVPAQDIPLLHACLYLRQCYRHGTPVEDHKAQITRSYGPRGRNFANLCSAGYLEDWFLPLHTELQTRYPEDPLTARAKFLSIYDVVLNELPWTIFVCARTSKAKTSAAVIDKIQKNLQNGVRFLNLHGLGETNVKRVLAMMPEIQKVTGAVQAKMEQEPTRIFVRLEVP